MYRSQFSIHHVRGATMPAQYRHSAPVTAPIAVAAGYPLRTPAGAVQFDQAWYQWQMPNGCWPHAPSPPMPSLEAIPYVRPPTSTSPSTGASHTSAQATASGAFAQTPEAENDRADKVLGKQPLPRPCSPTQQNIALYDSSVVHTSFGEVYGAAYLANVAVRVVDNSTYQTVYSSGTGLMAMINTAYMDLVKHNELWRPASTGFPNDKPWDPPMAVAVAQVVVCQSSREAVLVVGMRNASASPNTNTVGIAAVGRWRPGAQAQWVECSDLSLAFAPVVPGGAKRKHGDATDFYDQAHRHLQLYVLPGFWGGASARSPSSPAVSWLEQYVADTISSSLTVMSVRGWECGDYVVAPSQTADIAAYRSSDPCDYPPSTAAATFTVPFRPRRCSSIWRASNAYAPPATAAPDSQRTAGTVPCYTPVSVSVDTRGWAGYFGSVKTECYERPPMFTEDDCANLNKTELAALPQWRAARAIFAAVGGYMPAANSEESEYLTRNSNATMAMGYFTRPTRLSCDDIGKSDGVVRMAGRYELLARLHDLQQALNAAARAMGSRSASVTRVQSLGMAQSAVGQVFGRVEEVREHEKSGLLGYVFKYPYEADVPSSVLPCTPAIIKYTNQATAIGQLMVLASMFSAVTEGSEMAEKLIASIDASSPTATLESALHKLAGAVNERRLDMAWPWARIYNLRTPSPPDNAGAWPSVWSPREVPVMNSDMAQSTLLGAIHRKVRLSHPCTSRVTDYLVKMAEVGGRTSQEYAEETVGPDECPGPTSASEEELAAFTAAIVALVRLSVTIDALYSYEAMKAGNAAYLERILETWDLLGSATYRDWIKLARLLCKQLLVARGRDGMVQWGSAQVISAQRTLGEFAVQMGTHALAHDVFHAKHANRRPGVDSKRLRPTYR